MSVIIPHANCSKKMFCVFFKTLFSVGNNKSPIVRYWRAKSHIYSFCPFHSGTNSICRITMSVEIDFFSSYTTTHQSLMFGPKANSITEQMELISYFIWFAYTWFYLRKIALYILQSLCFIPKLVVYLVRRAIYVKITKLYCGLLFVWVVAHDVLDWRVYVVRKVFPSSRKEYSTSCYRYTRHVDTIYWKD